ncbi:hypothetical protein BDN70DRAFT_877714 [Pholiota conissans]|uniref:Uncharacterized protein n=1 Tax=Pholiota conissans TaxID=109636 RepID=A0A9P6D1M2_9AGAR|nr:hypothetical protein BDN70DRAFT_877714 [Pholiota conissans]
MHLCFAKVVIPISAFLERENEVVQLLQETRLAQLATIEQQRELVKYVQDLHHWIERDVQERKSEREDLSMRIERLNEDVVHRFR